MRRIVNSTYVSLDGVIEHLERWHFDYEGFVEAWSSRSRGVR